MPEITDDMLSYLDKAAYNRPQEIPPAIKRNDQAAYRVYFRFMCIVYKLYGAGVMSAEELKQIKSDFLEDFLIYRMFFNINAKGTREVNRISSALNDCRKNSEACPKCKAVSHIWGAATRSGEEDIIIPKEGDENGSE